MYKKMSLKVQCFGEFIGTGLIVLLGNGCLAASKLTTINLNHLEIEFISGLTASIAIYISYPLSGAHLNPIITISLWILNQTYKKKVIYYLISQISGAFCSSALVYYIYSNLLIDFEIKKKITRGSSESLALASIFSTYPYKNTNLIQIFNIEIIITIIFIILLMLLSNFKNKKNYFNVSPLVIGFFISILNIVMTPLVNFSINPALDLGPRIFIGMIGWGKIAFTGGINIPYFIIPILSSFIGTYIGIKLYTFIFN